MYTTVYRNRLELSYHEYPFRYKEQYNNFLSIQTGAANHKTQKSGLYITVTWTPAWYKKKKLWNKEMTFFLEKDGEI